MGEPAGILVDWARLQANQAGDTCLHMGEARVPVDASQGVAERMLRAAIGQWLRWQTGRGWKLVSDVHIGKPSPTFDTRTGRVVPESRSYQMTGLFEYRGIAASMN